MYSYDDRLLRRGFMWIYLLNASRFTKLALVSWASCQCNPISWCAQLLSFLWSRLAASLVMVPEEKEKKKEEEKKEEWKTPEERRNAFREAGDNLTRSFHPFLQEHASSWYYASCSWAFPWSPCLASCWKTKVSKAAWSGKKPWSWSRQRFSHTSPKSRCDNFHGQPKSA